MGGAAVAQFEIAFEWILQSEDPEHLCVRTADAPPAHWSGPCYAISGINSAVWPEEFKAVAALQQEKRLPAVGAFYRRHFWNQWYAQLRSDEVAKRVFDFAVNGGSGTAVGTLQAAIRGLGIRVEVDNVWGPKTVAAANGSGDRTLTAAFIAQRVAYYQAVAAVHPEKAQYLKGWLARARK